MHFIGSHPITCNKLSSKEYLKYPDEATFKINCYVESIRQTDNDLKSVYEILTRNLQENNESFSMIYFSDHGLTHVKKPVELLAVEHIAKEHLHSSSPNSSELKFELTQARTRSTFFHVLL
ncbi:sulfatase-like hydrolase/transferase [Campylobacter sp. 7477a]|uniref:sulfatase-like hydrolase/transferase n=1 Tax=Campylobacter sp. 7477a TaxID=2735741 RepID=UPI0030157BFA